MGKTITRTKYVTIKLPIKIVEMADAIVHEQGFTSRPDLIKYLVRKQKEQTK